MGSKKVLLVDDTRLNRELAKDILEMKGYQVITAVDGTECLASVHQHKPDIILLDIELPDISGLEIVRIIKKDPETKDIPVIALTVHDQTDDTKNFLAAGFAGHIPKPFDVKKFPQLVAEFLKS